MSALVQSLVVFGIVYFSFPGTNTTPIQIDSANPTPVPNIDRGFEQPEQYYVTSGDNYTYTPGIGAYKVHTQSESWGAARRICLAEDGYLAVINSVAEADHIAKLARTSGSYVGSSDSDYVLIGFLGHDHDHEFETVQGGSLAAAGFSEWEPGKPSNSNGNCGSLNRNTGKLNDISCILNYGFVCELFQD